MKADSWVSIYSFWCLAQFMALLGVQSAFLNMWMCVAEHSKHVFRVIRFFHPSTHAHPRIRSFSQSQVSLEVWSLVFHHIFHVMGEEKAMPALQTGETKIQIPDQTHVSLDLQNHLPTSFLFCFVLFCFLIEGKLVHSVMLVSAIQ